ncbi:MAG: AMP-binding protein [Propionibacteriaceae bacterium]|nr:AMP-binding protein [Propionibacteriaceae bacterium]
MNTSSPVALGLTTLPGLLDYAAQTYPTRQGLSVPAEHLEWSFPQLNTQAQAWSAWFAHRDEAGGPGSRIAIIGSVSYSWLMAFLAVTCSGRVAVPIDVAASPDEIGQMLRQTGAILTLTDREDLITELTNSQMSCLTLSETFPARPCPLADLGEADIQEVAGSDTAVMIFTSGTSGAARCVRLSQDNLTSNAVASSLLVGACQAGDCLLPVLPFHHLYGLNTTVMTAIVAGATVVFADGPRHFLRALTSVRPTHLVLVPMIVMSVHAGILAEVERRGHTRSFRFALVLSRLLLAIGIDARGVLFRSVRAGLGGRLRIIVSGGAHLDPSYVTAFADLGIRVLVGYGVTECSPMVTANPIGHERAGTVGRVAEGVEVALIDQEICVRGRGVMQGYDDPDLTKACFYETGWFRTGDLGSLSDDGFLTLTGRIKALIVLSDGNNVDPEVVEQALMTNPVVESALVSGFCEGAVEGLAARVHPNPDVIRGMSPEEVRAVCEAAIDAYNDTVPFFRQVRRVFVQERPFQTTSLGKVKRYLYQPGPAGQEVRS